MKASHGAARRTRASNTALEFRTACQYLVTCSGPPTRAGGGFVFNLNRVSATK